MDYYCVETRLKLLLLTLMLSFSTLAFGQAEKVRISIKKNDITIKEALREVEKQTKMSVAYNQSKLEDKSSLSLDVNAAPLNEVLNEILKDTDFTYELKGDQIMIIPKKKDVNSVKRTIKGTVIDELGEPLIGATIVVKGGSSGTITDFDGNYTIVAGSSDALIFSYVGYLSKEVKVDNQSVIDVEMASDAKQLETVVVTALGIKRAEKSLSYNAQTVSQEELLRNKDVNFVNSLAGKVAGVTINSGASGVGSASRVVIRGSKSIEQSNNVLYVVDGLPLFNFTRAEGTEHSSSGSSESIADLNPEDVESMTVLTGAAASALYGSEAANGAIIITTKKGKEGRTSLTVSQSTDFRRIFVAPKFQNKYGTGVGGVNYPMGEKDKSWGAQLNPSNYIGYSPTDDFLKTGVVTTETFSLSTGTEKNQTYLSAAAVNSVGMVPKNDYSRYNFSFRNTTSLLNDKMSIDVGASYIKQKDSNMTNQGQYSNALVSAYLFPRGDSWNDIKMFERWNTQRKIYEQYWPQGLNEFTGQNPYWISHRNKRDNNKDRYMFNANVSYDILDWLNVMGRARIDNSNNTFQEKLYATSNTTLTEGSNNGLYGIEQSNEKQIYADFLVNINKTFENQISLHANLGASISDIQLKKTHLRGPLWDQDDNNFGIPNKFNIQNLDYLYSSHDQGGYTEKNKALFASVELGYKSAYFLTLTGRNEWPSQLAGPKSDRSSFFYPSVGTSFILSEIFNMPREIDYLKLRGSFASVGLPYQRHLALEVYKWLGKTRQYEGSMDHYPMTKLKPERTDSWEVGLTMKFLKDFNFDLTFYHARTYNQTINAQISASSGYKNFYVQSGDVRNRGIELALGYNKKWGDFAWSSNYTLSSNSNKINKLVQNYKHPTLGTVINKDQLTVGGFSNVKFILKEGGKLGDMYSLLDLRRDSNGDVYIDETGKPQSVKVNEGEIKLGNVDPKANMAWNNSFSWKGFNLGFLISARLGGVTYSATQAIMDFYGVSEQSAKARDAGGVTINGGDVINPEVWYTEVGKNNGIPQYYTYSATNVRLQELSLGYTFSKKQLWNVAEASVSLIGRNLWMIYNKAPFDPETVATVGNYYRGIDYFMMPNARNLGFSVKLKF